MTTEGVSITRMRGQLRQNRQLGKDADELIAIAAETELSGGSITNVVRRCALYLIKSEEMILDKRILKEALQKEKLKS